MKKITEALISKNLSDELKNESQAYLETLNDLGKSKINNYKEEIKINLIDSNDKTFPVNAILSVISDVRICSRKHTDDIGKTLDEILKGFISEKKEHVSKTLISNSIEPLFTNSDNTESEIKDYFLISEDRFLNRLDFVCWTRNLKPNVLIENLDTMFVFVMYKSTVDMEKVHANDFIKAYMKTVKIENPEVDKVDEITNKCIEIYKKYRY
ncbi:hypothetical protein HIO71_13420 [Chryseobacterium aquaticum]|uniref:Uncharacterized protein n=1 Tax=Chryseobacterium aquaticum TaxID=452084 RepID=A0A848NA23_9FLAO|nr:MULTISPECIES: hypothetical protein [Chryseobacterium]NMR35189.1 hypothetical protein [Chryseobacterium aquaticum]NRQ47374.1 hypothetical protein [Chryseobacterium sp. C-204]